MTTKQIAEKEVKIISSSSSAPNDSLDYKISSFETLSSWNEYRNEA